MHHAFCSPNWCFLHMFKFHINSFVPGCLMNNFRSSHLEWFCNLDLEPVNLFNQQIVVKVSLCLDGDCLFTFIDGSFQIMEHLHVYACTKLTSHILWFCLLVFKLNILIICSVLCCLWLFCYSHPCSAVSSFNYGPCFPSFCIFFAIS